MGRTSAPALREVRSAVRQRLDGSRLTHVESVAETVRSIAESHGWSAADREAVERAAWYHDACKPDGEEAWRATIRARGETPDPWAEAHVPELLHAQAAAAWAAGLGEADPAVLSAVRHHPTGHPGWGSIGKLLYLADFAEPTRLFAGEVESDSLREEARSGSAGLESAARTVLALRLARLLERGRPIHPDGWLAWNAWLEAAG